MSEIPRVTVRLAAANDLDALTIHNYIPRERIARMIEQHQFAITELNARPIGYAGLDWLVTVHPFLAMIWVFEDYRRQGIGAAPVHQAQEMRTHLRIPIPRQFALRSTHQSHRATERQCHSPFV